MLKKDKNNNNNNNKKKKKKKKKTEELFNRTRIHIIRICPKNGKHENERTEI